MRHFLLVLLPGTITPCTLGMLAAPVVARLIAPPCCPLFAAPVLRGAASLTVDVAAVAARTDQHLHEAACADIQARGCSCLFAIVAQTWTKAPAGGILPRQTCLGTLWGAAPIRTCRLGSAPRLSSTKTALNPPSSPFGVAASRAAQRLLASICATMRLPRCQHPGNGIEKLIARESS